MRFSLFMIESPYRPHAGPSGSRLGEGAAPAAGLTSPHYLSAVARYAEEVGFDGMVFPEHVVLPVEYGSYYPYQQYEGDEFKRYPFDETIFPEPLAALAFVAAVTSRLRLGTSVLILPQRNPVVLAKQLATIDALSEGRVQLAIGLGWLREEFEAIGVPWKGRARRADEYIQAMRALWTQAEATFQGETVSFERIRCLPKPARAEGIPIIVGGHSEGAARRAGRLGDGFMPLGYRGADHTPLIEQMREAAREAGRDPDAIEIHSGASPDLEEVQRLADSGVAEVHFVLSAPDLETAKRELERTANVVIARVR